MIAAWNFWIEHCNKTVIKILTMQWKVYSKDILHGGLRKKKTPLRCLWHMPMWALHLMNDYFCTFVTSFKINNYITPWVLFVINRTVIYLVIIVCWCVKGKDEFILNALKAILSWFYKKRGKYMKIGIFRQV